MLQPPELLAGHMSLMGIRPTDRVILVPDDKPHDAGWSEWASRSELPVENDAQSNRKMVAVSLRGEDG
jgi:3-mercaptopyruvate sulfurtransferase SseA